MLRFLVFAFVGCYLPEWKGVPPAKAPREDPCGSGALTHAGRAVMHRAPFLQRAEETGVTVVWAGIPEGTPRVVVAHADDKQRGEVAAFEGRHPGSTRVAAAQRSELFDELHDDDDDDASEPLEAADFYELAATVRGLERGKRYCYRVVSERGALTDWATLATAPSRDPARVDRFIVLGDTGTGSRAQHAIARHLERWPMDAILFVGDIAYPSGTHEQLQKRFFEVYDHVVRRVPVYPAIGNHDRRAGNGAAFFEAFVLPGNERWYSFDSGDVHFVVLDSTRIGTEQASWLAHDLARNDRTFTVVLSHHPPYSAGFHGSHDSFKRLFGPLLAHNKVELVISGHDHHYERTRPIDGTVYLVSGGGGARLRDVRPTRDTVRAITRHHFLVLEAHKDKLVVGAIDIDGKLIDHVEIAPRSKSVR